MHRDISRGYGTSQLCGATSYSYFDSPAAATSRRAGTTKRRPIRPDAVSLHRDVSGGYESSSPYIETRPRTSKRRAATANRSRRTCGSVRLHRDVSADYVTSPPAMRCRPPTSRRRHRQRNTVPGLRLAAEGFTIASRYCVTPLRTAFQRVGTSRHLSASIPDLTSI